MAPPGAIPHLAMKTRRFLHLIAVIFSSLASFAHGQSPSEETGKKEKKSEAESPGTIARMVEARLPRKRRIFRLAIQAEGCRGRRHQELKEGGELSGAELEDAPPAKLDAALMAGAEQVVPSLASAPAAPPSPRGQVFPVSVEAPNRDDDFLDRGNRHQKQPRAQLHQLLGPALGEKLRRK